MSISDDNPLSQNTDNEPDPCFVHKMVQDQTNSSDIFTKR
jgi:hypothetical protein